MARHLAMTARLIDDDPVAAHQHALAASRHAGRIPVVRETVGITAYRTGDFTLALRELRTYRRLSGREDEIALMVDSERGVGHPERALELGRSVDRAALPAAVRAGLAIAMSGAWLDRDEPERALQELDIPESDPDRAFAWSPELFAARAVVLDALARDDEAAQWRRRADVAARALDEMTGAGGDEVVVVEDALQEDAPTPGDEALDAAPGAGDDASTAPVDTRGGADADADVTVVDAHDADDAADAAGDAANAAVAPVGLPAATAASDAPTGPTPADPTDTPDGDD